MAREARGISPVIATVILVAVTLAIAVAIVGWLFGLWGGLAGGSPMVTVPSANLYIVSSNGSKQLYLEVYIRNGGTGSDKIIRAELSNGATLKTCSPLNKTGAQAVGLETDFTVTGGEVLIPADSTGWVTFDCTGISFTPGQAGVARIMFEKSGVIPINVVAEQK